MKKEYFVIKRKEDGKSKTFESEKSSIEDIKDKINRNFSYGTFDINKRVKIIKEENLDMYTLPKMKVNRGLDESVIEDIVDCGNDLSFKISRPEIKQDKVVSMRRIKNGGRSFTFSPKEYDFSLRLDTEKSYDGGFEDLDKDDYDKVITKLSKETGLSFQYVSSKFSDHNKIPRSNREGKTLNVYVVLPRKEMFGYFVKEEIEKENNNLSAYNPAEITCAVNRPRPIYEFERIRQDRKKIGFVFSNEKQELSKDILEIIDLFRVERSMRRKKIFNDLGFSETPSDILSKTKGKLGSDIVKVSSGFIDSSDFDSENVELKPGVFIRRR